MGLEVGRKGSAARRGLTGVGEGHVPAAGAVSGGRHGYSADVNVAVVFVAHHHHVDEEAIGGAGAGPGGCGAVRRQPPGGGGQTRW